MTEFGVYDIDRVRPPAVPPELAAADDVEDVHFVPAPCQVACPIGTDAPSYIAYIWEGKIEEAFEAITATNPFSYSLRTFWRWTRAIGRAVGRPSR